MKNINTINYIKREKYVFVTDETFSFDSLLIALTVYKKIETIVVPHNLESLVPEQKSPFSLKKTPHWFREEIGFLALADTVYVISREEQWLLRCMGVANTFYFPYEVQKDKSRFLFIRGQRVNSEKKGYLIFGSSGNPPARLGMITLLQYIERINSNIIFYVVGNETDELKSSIYKSNIVFLGKINDEELDKLMITTKGVILYQTPTSGALTKIPELLLMNVPIIANEMALRNFWNLPNTFVYNNLDELRNLIDFQETAL